MAPVMKVVMRWEDDKPELKTVLKMKLPRKWKDGPTLNLKKTFVESFNEKHPEQAMDIDQIHLENSKGEAFADEDIVIRVLKSGGEVLVRSGAPPKELLAPIVQGSEDVPGVANTAGAAAAAASKSTKPAPKSSNTPLQVASKDAIKAAVESQAGRLDYSKWDRLDLSDDDEADCHPNIDKDSWKRLKAQQRVDRREKEDETLKKLTGKIDKYERKATEVQKAIDEGDDSPQRVVDLRDAQSSAERYRVKKEHFLGTRKLVAEDLCEVKEDHTTIAPAETKPALPLEAPVDEAESYDTYVKANDSMLMKYSQITDDEVAQEFILSHKHILNAHAEGFLLLLCLDACMRHKAEPVPLPANKAKAFEEEEYRIAKQHLVIHYLMELAKGMKREPIEAVVPFFRKASKRSPDQVQGFDEDLKAFVARIRKRADDKIANNEVSPLADDPNEGIGSDEEEEYEAAGVGPGGLDPNVVLNSLPSDLAEAFVDQDTPRLKAVLAALPADEAQLHMQNCIDSGLWVADAAEKLV